MSIENRGIRPGDEVYTADEEHLGTVTEAHADYLHVRHGRLFGQDDHYFPSWTIGRALDERVYLTLSKAELEGQDWSVIPRAGETRESRFATPSTTASATATGVTERMAAPIDYSVEREVADVDAEVLDQREIVVPIVEERLEIRKAPIELGEVVINREIVENRRTFPIDVVQEDVRIERRVAGREATAEDLRFNAGEGLNFAVDSPAIIPLIEEIVEVRKRLMVREELVVSKVRVTERREITETTRRSEPRIASTGDLQREVGIETAAGAARAEQPATPLERPAAPASAAPAASAAARTVEEANLVVPVVEERLDISKRAVDVGEVLIERETVTREQTVPVDVAHEEVRVERRAADREATPDDLRLAGGEGLGRLAEGETLIIPLIEEVADVRKRMIVREELVLTKVRRTEHHEITETVRRVEPRLESVGALERDVAATTTATAATANLTGATTPTTEVRDDLRPNRNPFQRAGDAVGDAVDDLRS